MKNEHPEGQKTIDDYQEKDSLTESDIKAIEEKLVNQFNLRFNELAKRVMESPPTSAAAIQNIHMDIHGVFQLSYDITQTMKSLNGLKLD